MGLAIPQADRGFSRLDDICDGLVSSEFTAVRLELVGLKLIGTDDLRRHLLLDQRLGVLHVFHFASFLKESLKETQGDPSGLL
jgi:hypothetical protein